MNNRSKLTDLLNRCYTGPVMTEEDFDLNSVYMGLNKIVKKYDISFPNDNIINLDDEFADRVWNAGIEFLADCGIYSKDTGRVIKYTENEIRELARHAQSEAIYGEGRDAVLEAARTPDDSRPPSNCGGPIGIPCPNEYYLPLMLSYFLEPGIELSNPVSLNYYMGLDVRAKAPTELLASVEEIRNFKHAAALAGRPGLGFGGGINVSATDIGHLGAGQLLGPGDGHSFGLISELKIDLTVLNKLAYTTIHDVLTSPFSNPIYGGLGGGVEGQAVLLCAGLIACGTILFGTTNGCCPTHPVFFCSDTKEIMQFNSVVFQAIARNSKIMTRIPQTFVGGPGTKTLLYEVIASTTNLTKSGVTRLQGPRPATGAYSGLCSGLEARFAGEVSRAAVKLTREEADKIVRKAYAMYEDDLDKKPYGKPFWEVYDVKTIKPTEEWQRMYDEVREEAIGWGLPLDQI